MSHSNEVIDGVRCPVPTCLAEPGEPCWHSSMSHEWYMEEPHLERSRLFDARRENKAFASSVCPICGVDKPHSHGELEQKIRGMVSVELPASLLLNWHGGTNRDRVRAGWFFARAIHRLMTESAAPAGTAPTVIEGGQLWRTKELVAEQKIRWLVLSVNNPEPYPISAQRSDGWNQTHVGGFDERYFREAFELVSARTPAQEVAPPVPPSRVDPWEALKEIGLAVADAADQAEADDRAGLGARVAPLESAMLRIGKAASRALASRAAAPATDAPALPMKETDGH